MTYSILPVLRWESAEGEYKSITISESTKVTRDFPCNLLADNIVYSLQDLLFKYKLQGLYVDLFIMGRPWLSDKDFSIKMSDVTYNLKKQIEKEISSRYQASLINNQTYSELSLNLKIYKYANIFMNNYGDPIFDVNKNLIGYKISNNTYASVKTFYN